MAQNIRQQGMGGTASRQIVSAQNAHASGDLCYDSGFYGIAADDVAVGQSFRMYTDCIAVVAVPGGTAIGAPLYSPSKPTGAITLTATSGGNVLLGIVVSALDANNNAEFQMHHALSMGR